MVYLKLLKSTKARLLIIIFLTFLAYSNIFQNQFATDDTGYIFNWQIPKHLQNIPKIFTTDSVPEDEQGVYRPVKALFFMLSYYLWGFDVFGFHMVSIIVHLSSTVLVYFVTLKIIQNSCLAGRQAKIPPAGRAGKIQNFNLKLKSFKKTSSVLPFDFSLLPFLTALLFGLHPIHVEAVTFITAAYDTTGLLFYLLSFYFFISSPKKNILPLRFFLSLIFALLAFFTYELTFSLPLALLLYDFCFNKKLFKRPIHYLAKTYLPFILALFACLFIRFFLLHIPTRGQYLDGNFYLTMLVMPKAILQYLIILFYPVNLNMNHEIFPGVFSVVSREFINVNTLKSLSIFNREVLISLLIIFSLITLAVKYYGKLPLLTFAIGFFFISLLPVSYILPQSSIMAERYAYLASFGFVLLLAYGIFWASGKIINIIQNSIRQPADKMQNYNSKLKSIKTFDFLPVLLPFAFCILTFYGIRTYLRNKDWRDTITIWQANVSASPNDPNANLTLARIYEDNQNYSLADIYYKKALNLNPNVPVSYYSLGQFQFRYPKAWQTYPSETGVILKHPDQLFVVEFIKDAQSISTDFSYGTLIKEGLAKIPDFDQAYVRFWDEKMEFILKKGVLNIKILVYPKNSPLMKEFDKILGSIKIK